MKDSCWIAAFSLFSTHFFSFIRSFTGFYTVYFSCSLLLSFSTLLAGLVVLIVPLPPDIDPLLFPFRRQLQTLWFLAATCFALGNWHCQSVSFPWRTHHEFLATVTFVLFTHSSRFQLYSRASHTESVSNIYRSLRISFQFRLSFAFACGVCIAHSIDLAWRS